MSVTYNKTNPSLNLEHAKAYIQSVDLSMVVDRLVYIDNWPRKKALQAVSLYRNYLFLLKKYPDHRLPPSYEIDEAWHAHILYTKHYVEFCENLFGCYLHHEPEDLRQENQNGIQRLETLFEITQEFYKKEFGDYIYQFKRRPWHIHKLTKIVFQKWVQ